MLSSIGCKAGTFFRANRQLLINYRAITDAEHYFNGRLLVNLTPAPDKDVLVSKARTSDFKEWLRKH